jgi:hypothetical protein
MTFRLLQQKQSFAECTQLMLCGTTEVFWFVYVTMQCHRSIEFCATVLSAAKTMPAIREHAHSFRVVQNRTNCIVLQYVCVLLLMQLFGLHYACCFWCAHAHQTCATLHTWITARYDLLLNFSTRAKTAPDEFMAEYMMFGGGRLNPTIEVRTCM